MREISFVIVLVLSASKVFATPNVVCDGSFASADPRKAGFIVYEIGDMDCSRGGKDTPCYKQIEKDRDDCVGNEVVLKVSCRGHEPVSERVKCPEGTTCRKGACQ